MESFSFSKKFLSGEIHIGSGRFIAQGIATINTFLIISSLTVYQYGAFQLLLSTYGLVSEFITLGGAVVSTDLQRFLGAGKEAEAKRLFWEHNLLRAAIGTLLFLATFFGAPLLSFRYGVEFLDLIRVTSFFFLLDTLINIMQGILKARLAFRELGWRRPISKAAQLAALVAFLLFGTVSIKEVLIAMIVGQVASILVFLPATVRAYRTWHRVRALRSMLLPKIFKSYGKWEIVRQLLSQSTTNLQPWLVKFFISTEAVAIFNAAVAIADVFKSLMATNTLGPLMSRSVDEERFGTTFRLGTKYLVWWSCILALLGGAFGTLGLFAAVRLGFFDSAYLAAIPLFYMLLVAFPLEALKRMLDIFLTVLRRQKFVFFRGIVRDLLHLGLLSTLLPLLGLTGFPIARFTVSAYVVLSTRYYLAGRSALPIMPFRDFFSYREEDRETLARLYRDLRALIRSKRRQLFGRAA